MTNDQSRRAFLRRTGGGLGLLALLDLLANDGALPLLAAEASGPLAPKPSHFPASAKSVIHLFMYGGPSQVDLFDPKPELQRRDGQPLPLSSGEKLDVF